jgi:DNA-binding response OmpR family regulator
MPIPQTNILLAEDDEILAWLLSSWLEKSGHTVFHVTNGMQVKEYLKENTPDLLISDIMMPYFSGIELVEYIRTDLRSKMPIILISAASNDQNILNAFELGANDFLAKPISPPELLVRVNRVIKTVGAV